MSKLPFSNPVQARKVWEGMARPSSRRVARKLRQAGRPVSHETVNRWRRKGWRCVEQEARHPLEISRDRLDDAVPVLTGDPMTTSTTFVRERTDREALELLTDDELLRRSAREVLNAVTVIARAMLLKPAITMTRPAEVGILMRALAESLRAATAVLAREPNGSA